MVANKTCSYYQPIYLVSLDSKFRF